MKVNVQGHEFGRRHNCSKRGLAHLPNVKTGIPKDV